MLHSALILVIAVVTAPLLIRRLATSKRISARTSLLGLLVTDGIMASLVQSVLTFCLPHLLTHSLTHSLKESQTD